MKSGKERGAIAGLILAAGESRRMGRDKALLAYRGRTFLETILSTLRRAGVERIVVVLGHHADEIQKGVNLKGASVVVNRDYRLGQTSSLQAGLRALEGEEVEAVVLCLVDHPAVTVATIRKLAESFRKTRLPVVVPKFQGRRGHPVVLSRALFEQFGSLAPDQGANTVVRKYREATELVEVNDPGVLLDVDDPETYRNHAE